MQAACTSISRSLCAGKPSRWRKIKAEPRKPWFSPPASRTPPERALVIGAGIAGAATARAFAEHGLPVTVLEAAAPALARFRQPPRPALCQDFRPPHRANRITLVRLRPQPPTCCNASCPKPIVGAAMVCCILITTPPKPNATKRSAASATTPTSTAPFPPLKPAKLPASPSAKAHSTGRKACGSTRRRWCTPCSTTR